MVSKKASRGPVSKVSSAAAPTQSDATTLSSHKSSLLRSAFSPSEYQLALFASVIQSLDAPHLRIHDVNSGRLQGDHAVKPRESITSLDWGCYGHAHRDRDHLHPKKKKRKRSSGVNGVADDAADDDVDKGGDVVVAFGTSTSEIRMYSPAEDKVVGTLSGVHERGIRDFKFTSHKPGVEGWSIGGDGKLVQWDLHKSRSIRVVPLPSTSVTTLSRPVSSNPPVLCASQAPYVIDLEKGDSLGETSFSAMRNTIHSLISSSADLSNLPDEFLAADSDRYINVFDRQKRKLLGSLVTDTGVECLSLHRSTHQKKGGDQASSLALLQRQVLAAVTDDGTVELFAGPFHQFRDPLISNPQGSLKSKGKSRTRRADAVIRLVRPDKTRSVVPIVSASFHGPDLVIAWVEGAANLLFHRMRWQEENSEGLSLRGEVEVVKTKTSSLPGSAVVNGVKDIGKTHVDETHAVVEQGGVAEGLNVGATQKDAIMVLSDEDQEGAVASQSDSEEATPVVGSAKPPTKEVNEDVAMADDDDDDGEHGEPSFGELLRANASEPIDVEAALEESKADSGALVPASKHDTTALEAPSGLTLSTVLTQSLKTNDNSLLESCFHSTDMNVVRATIQRIDSSLATTLLQKLAERLSSRPGRYGHLLVWVQWTCVAHGGAIAGRPDILKQMTSLFRVMDQRSASLSSLLLLKGKLDMLDAQLSLRQGIQDRDGRARGEDEGEENVIYVDGQEDEAESGDDEKEEERGANAEPVDASTTSTRARSGKLGGGVLEADEEEDDEHMPLVVNGIASDDEDEKEEEEEDLVDDEAELSADDEDEVSEDEEEEEKDDDDDDESMEDFVADSAEESDASVDAQPVATASSGVSKGASTSKAKPKAKVR